MTLTDAPPRDSHEHPRWHRARALERGRAHRASPAPRRADLEARGLSVCPGCGLVLPLHGGPTHAYVGASPACWSLYGQLPTAFRMSAVDQTVRRLALDTYAVQHPGRPQLRSVQSVAVHAMGLCVLLERGAEERRVKPVLGRRPTRRPPALHWLEPPRPNGTLTVRDSLGIDEPEDYVTAVRSWAVDVWAAWEPHHNTIRRWLDVA
jgi:Family of unknown function (DUF5946)